MKSIPFFGLNATDDRRVRPLFGNRLSGGNGDEEAGLGAFLIQRGGNGTGLDPVFGVWRDVLSSDQR